MKIFRPIQTFLGVIFIVSCVMFLAFAGTASFGRTLMIADDDASINVILDQIVKEGTGNCDAPLEKVIGDGFTDDRSFALTAPERWGDPGWGYHITEDPFGDNEYRFFTIAWKVDAPGTIVQIQFIPLDSRGDWPRFYAGDEMGSWPNLASLQLAAEPPREWELHIVDLFALRHGRKAFFGEWTMSGISFDSDWPECVSTAYFDALYLTQTQAEADEVIASVEPADKLATTWAAIKSQ